GADGADHLDAAAELRGGDGLVGALAARGHPPAAAMEGLPRPRMAHHLGAEVDVDRADHRDRTGGAHSNSPALSSVTVTTSTETSASTSPSASTLAASATACLPSSAGCWAMVASSVPAATAAMPSSVPSKPTTVTSVPARSPSASIAPSAISSFSQKMPTTSGLACSRLVATFRPSARSKFAVCWATTVMSENCSMPSVKPWPRSREAEEPGTPCSTITSPSSPIAAARASAAWVPPATLSEAMKLASSPEVASRSTAMTGMSASLSDSTEVETASESVGLTITRAWPWVMALASWLAWVAESSEASCTSRLMPCASASASAPSTSSTKKGLVWVETASMTRWPPPPSPSPPRLQAARPVPATAAAPRASRPRRLVMDLVMVIMAISLSRGAGAPRGWGGSAGGLAAQHVEADGEGDHETDHDLLPERRDVEDVQAVADHGQQDRAHERAGGAAGAAGEGGPADDHGGDGVQLVADAGLRAGRGQPTGQHHAGQPREQAG